MTHPVLMRRPRAPISLPAPSRFRSADPEETHALSEAMLMCRHDMAVPRTSKDFLARVSFVTAGELGVFSTSYVPSVTIHCEPPIPWVTVNVVTSGRGRLRRQGQGEHELGGRAAAIIDYRRPIDLDFGESAVQRMVTIPRARVDEFVSRLLGRELEEPVRFEPALDLNGDGGLLSAAVANAYRIASGYVGHDMPAALAAELERSVLSALVFGHRHNHSDALLRPVPEVPRGVVDRVAEYVEAHAELPLSVGDLATHAGVSERTLFEAFRRERGVTPMAYLRERRLDRAREALANADAASDPPTVAAVAYETGFAHVGRFASAYRAAFGEAPSETLARSLGRERSRSSASTRG